MSSFSLSSKYNIGDITYTIETRRKNGKQIYAVKKNKFKINKIIFMLEKNGKTVSYVGQCGDINITRKEKVIFKTRTEAIEKCNELNSSKITMNIDDIFISEKFKRCSPNRDRMLKKLKFYNDNGFFEDGIILNKDNFLIDGYSTYLICKHLSIENVEVNIN